MWKALWRKWTIDKPAAFGNWLWDILVVQLAAFLAQLTIRQIIAFIPVVILIGAYYHRIPIPPELMLVGDLLAYIDVFSALFLLGILTRVGTIVLVVRQAASQIARLASALLLELRRFDVRHRRMRGPRARRRLIDRSKNDDSAPVNVGRLAWA